MITTTKIVHKGQNAVLAVINAYRKECGIQKRYGGIRSPKVVCTNKIRHICTNYDQVCLQISRMNVDEEVKFNLRQRLIEDVVEKVNEIIDSIEEINLQGKKVTREELKECNVYYFKAENERIIHERFVYRGRKR